jgi:hypothetical protein
MESTTSGTIFVIIFEMVSVVSGLHFHLLFHATSQGNKQKTHVYKRLPQCKAHETMGLVSNHEFMRINIKSDRGEIFGNISWNIVSPTKPCYVFE